MEPVDYIGRLCDFGLIFLYSLTDFSISIEAMEDNSKKLAVNKLT